MEQKFQSNTSLKQKLFNKQISISFNAETPNKIHSGIRSRQAYLCRWQCLFWYKRCIIKYYCLYDSRLSLDNINDRLVKLFIYLENLLRVNESKKIIKEAWTKNKTLTI